MSGVRMPPMPFCLHLARCVCSVMGGLTTVRMAPRVCMGRARLRAWPPASELAYRLGSSWVCSPIGLAPLLWPPLPAWSYTDYALMPCVPLRSPVS